MSTGRIGGRGCYRNEETVANLRRSVPTLEAAPATAPRSLREAVAQRAFRGDLYYRLSVMPVHLRPLRERPADIPPLVHFFVDAANREFDTNISGLEPDAMTALSAYSWPGNVREVRNAVERAVLLADEGVSTLALRHFAPGDDHADRHRLMLPADGLNLQQLERDLILQALTKADGNQTRAGALLGLNRDQMRYRVKKFGLTLPT